MNTIVLTQDGPLECRGELQIVTPEGIERARASETWLCRCGLSENKPYCDGSHRQAGFRDETISAVLPNADPRALAPLRITLRPNGPLRLDGPCEVRNAAGELLFAGDETALCRCGHSAKKPFCDGTHRKTGFAT